MPRPYPTHSPYREYRTYWIPLVVQNGSVLWTCPRPTTKDSRHLTAFATPWTIYHWIRIPFGLRNAPPAFQRYINQVLRDYKGVICEAYLDDILCFSKDSFNEHVEKLEAVLKRLEENGIKLRAEKCVFGKREVRYLGRLISAEGYRPDPADTAALQRFKEPPKTVGEVRSVLGFLGYYR